MASSPPPAVFSVAQALSMVRERRERAAEEETRRKLEEEKQRLDRAREKRRRRRKNQKERKAQLKSAREAADATKPSEESETHQAHQPDTLEPSDEIVINNHSPRISEQDGGSETDREVPKLSEPSHKPAELNQAPSRTVHKGLIPRALLVRMNKKI